MPANTPTAAELEAAIAQCERLGIPHEDAAEVVEWVEIGDALEDSFDEEARPHYLRIARDSLCMAVLRWYLSPAAKPHVAMQAVRVAAMAGDLAALTAALAQIGGAK